MRAALALSLLLAFPATAELRLETVRQSLTGTHCRYREYIDGIATDAIVISRCAPRAMLAASSAPAPEEGLRYVDGRLARREIRREQPLEPFAYDYDAATGALIRRMPLFFNAKRARVFDPNPVVALNDPSLQDRNDTPVIPDAAYRPVELDDAASEGPLRGPHATMVDRQAPSIAPPDASGTLELNRSEDGFEDVNAYFHVDRSQRHLQSLGYTGPRAVVPYAIEIDAHAASGGDNSFFIPSGTRIGYGTLYFGEGGTDDAEDADLVVHEYGHAILEWIAPGTFAGPFASQSRAIGEAFGDYWAWSAHEAARHASGRDPYCFADWDARCWEDAESEQCAYKPGSDCLRRLDDTRTMADYETSDVAGVEHRNGSIFSSALRELHERIGRDAADTIVIESLFDVPPRPSFATLARRMIEADRLLYGAAHASDICAVMAARGVFESCDAATVASQTFFQSSDRGVAIPENVDGGVVSTLTIDDARVIDRLFVRVDIAHPTRGDLRIDLVAPDGTTVMLQQVSFERGSDVHATFGLTADSAESLDVLRGRSAAGVWKLVVRDLRARDVGTLLSWGLEIQFAGAEPVSVRPGGSPSQTIPIVAHLYGVAAVRFASDVRIANVGIAAKVATLVFTPSGSDGRTAFSTVDIAVRPGQTIALDDVVESAFQTSGSGSLEILGDVIAMSRTYAYAGGGTLGQQVPPNLETTALGEEPLIAAVPRTHAGRVNAGVTETGGGSGVVEVGGRLTSIAPYSHVQWPADDRAITVRVLSGDARVVAYLSEVESASGDPLFVPAVRAPVAPRTVLAPVIRSAGVRGTAWQSDAWFLATNDVTVLTLRTIDGTDVSSADHRVNGVTVVEDVLGSLAPELTTAALLIDLPVGAIAMSRARTDSVSEFIPLLSPDGPAEQHLLFVEKTSDFRTNIGIVSDAPAMAEVSVVGAGGVEVERAILSTAGGATQLAVSHPVTSGRAVVRFIAGRGRAWASVVDNRTGDATYVPGQ